MTIDEFWDIVDRVHRASGGDMDKKCELLREELEKLSAKKVFSFDDHFQDCGIKVLMYELWGAVCIIAGGYCDDDDVSDFTGTLISMGQATFEQVITMPESLVDLPFTRDNLFYEGYQYIPNMVYEAMTGAMIDNDKDRPSFYEQDWNIDGLPQLFPRLFEKFKDRWLKD
jgi:hypothetical protein